MAARAAALRRGCTRSGSAGAPVRRSTMAPFSIARTSPGSSRKMPSKIVSRPVVNCSWSSSKAAFGRIAAGAFALAARRAATMAWGSDAKVTPSGPTA